MDKNKESMQGCESEQPIPLNLQNKIKIQDLERRVKRLEASVRILETLAQQYCKANGIKVERYQDGLVVISQI